MYKRQKLVHSTFNKERNLSLAWTSTCLLYTSDAADEGLGVDLGGRRIIKKKNS
ncbi:hypothetical protein JMUB7542_28100 [Staphylococcus aureus]